MSTATTRPHRRAPKLAATLAVAVAIAAIAATASSLPAPRPVDHRGAAAVAVGVTGWSQQLESRQTPRGLRLADYYELVSLRDVQVSPDGRAVVYVRSAIDREEDRWVSSIWAVSPDGRSWSLASSGKGDSSPRFSPDGRWLAFVSGRSGSSQVWLLPWSGGEAWRLTDLPEGVSGLSWAPDSARLVVVSTDAPAPAPPILPEDEDGEAAGTDEKDEEDGEDERPLPRVVTRLQFKQDGAGYLGPRRSHLYVVEVPESSRQAPAEARQITSGPHDDASPAWSPDGGWIAFTANRTAHPDANNDSNVWLVSPEGGDLVQVTRAASADGAPRWSPDSRWIAYLSTPEDPPVYADSSLWMVSVTPAEGDATAPPSIGQPLALTADLDRPLMFGPRWAADGTGIYVRMGDRGTVPVVRVATGLGPMGDDDRGRRRRDSGARGEAVAVLAGARDVEDFALFPDGNRMAVVLSSGTRPPEVFLAPTAPVGIDVPLAASSVHLQATVAPPDAALHRLTAENEEWRRQALLSEPEPIRFDSTDGAVVEGWLLRPPGADDNRRLPLLVRIHGGPVSQYTWGFSWEFQWLAARGYAVMYVNPRGSNGYGLDFAYALWQAWGEPDFDDLMAGIDHLVERGVVDPDRIGVGGWSYGGILTNYMITKSERFAAAVSGASETDYFSAYGTDDLQRWWEDELGLPWEARELYESMSPIHRVTEITTPTMFLVGELDWRVPLSQTEEMYTRLRRRMLDGGPPTGLIIYPDESHGIRRPSFQIDRFRRYLAWFDRHVRDDSSADPFFGERSW